MKQHRRYAIFIFLFSAFGVAASAQNGVAISTKESLEASVVSAPCENDERKAAVVDLFRKMGAAGSDIKIETFNKEKTSNVVVHLKGRSDETIIIGAHYDKTKLGCGVVDNWTGVSIIAHLYRSLSSIETKRSYTFVAFDREEEGLIGSREMVKAMSKEQIAGTCAMANFDSFGQTAPYIFRSVSSKGLSKRAKEVAKRSDLELLEVNIQNASTDSASFIKKKIPSIALTGLGRDWGKILHTNEDQFEKVNMDSVYLAYRFGLLFVIDLETAACSDLR